jgi:methanogenic corrinoid protein MtbC1
MRVAEDYACLLLDSGADVLWISDPLAALLPPDCFEAFAGRYLQQLFRLKPDRASILHICGDVTDLLPRMLATSVGGISLDQCMAMPAVEDQLNSSVALIGNLDPLAEVAMGTRDSVSVATRELTMMMGVRSNFILSTGCALPPKTPLANICTFIEAGRSVLLAIRERREFLAPLAEAVSRGDETATVHIIDQCIAHGDDPFLMINAGLMRSIRRASALYEARRCYLPEILLAVEAFYSGIARLGPLVKKHTSAGPQVLLGTVRGDLHAIGKDLVRIMLEANGFDVFDLGVDVSAEEFGDAVRKYHPKIVGLSAFITSAREQLPGFIETIRSAVKTPLKIVVGGAAVNTAVASQVGADGYAREAVAAVRLIRDLGAISTMTHHENHA